MKGGAQVDRLVADARGRVQKVRIRDLENETRRLDGGSVVDEWMDGVLAKGQG
jgi:hypothetical protein